jgi:putative ABC transport system substrate-binding protein
MAGLRIFALLAAFALASINLSEAQQQTRVARIGWLGTRPASGPTSGPIIIQQELTELGYVEGKNLIFERRYTEGKLDRLSALSNDLVRFKVDVILTGSTPSAKAAKSATRTIPIVFWTEADPVVAGLFESLARPGARADRVIR